MSKRALWIGLVAAFTLVIFGTETRAQSNRPGDPDKPVTVETAEATVVPPLRVAAEAREAVRNVEQTPRLAGPRPPSRMRPTSVVLGSLYVSTAVMQGLDVHSTLNGLRQGAAEANPVMKGLVKNPVVFAVAKGAITYGSILAARRMAKKSKVAAIVSLAVINTMYGAIVHHNYQVARRMR